MVKKFLAALTAFALSLGIVALTAAPASAHHNTINAVVSCNTGTEGTWKVTWTIANSEGIDERITSSNDTSIVPVDTVIAGGDTLTVIRYYSTKPTSDKTLTLAAKWTNNNTATNSGTLYKSDFKDNCLPDDTGTKISLCHANNGNGWTLKPNETYKSVLENNGHAVHMQGRDIIPPFSYVQQGVPGTFAGLNWTAYGQSVYNNGCSTSFKPDVPSFADAVCTPENTPGTVGQYFIPGTNADKFVYYVAVTNSSNPPADNNAAWTLVTNPGTWVNVAVGKWVHVRAEGINGYTTSSPDQWKDQIGAPSASDCLPDVAPTEPQITQAVCVANNDAQGSYTIPNTLGLIYQVYNSQTNQWQVTTAGTYPANDGTDVYVRVYAADGYELTSTDHHKDYKSYTLEFNGYDDSKCQVPTEPQADYAHCTGPDQSSTARFFVPTDSGVQYKVYIDNVLVTTVAGWNDVTGLPKTVKIVASAAPGNVIVPGSTTEWPFAFSAAGPCLVDTPSVAPDWTDAYCYANTTGSSPASFTVNGTPGDHVSYWISTTGVNGTYSPIADGPHAGTVGQTVWITAMPDAGYQLKDYTGPWSHTFTDPGDCLDDGVPADPTFVDGSCVEPGTGVNNGYYIVDGGTNVSYEVKVNDGPWTPVDPTTYGVKVYVNPGDKVEIMAVPDSGYKLTGDEQGPWSHTFTDPGACLDKAPVDPIAHVNQECKVDDEATGAWHYEPGTITIPTTPHVTYSIDGTEKSADTYEYGPGVYVISAEADPGYYLTGVPDPWEVEILKDLPCGLPTYPTVTPTVSFVQTTCTVAGSYTLGVDPAELAEGVIWTVSGGLPNTLGKHAVNTAGTVTITATPAPGYGFGDGLPGSVREWKYDFTSLPDDCLPTLAFTGSSIATGGLGLAGLLTLGGILMVVAHRRRAALIEE